MSKKTGKKEKAWDWLVREEHDDEEMLAAEHFSPTATFEEIARRMRAGETFYEVAGGDTTERENCQERLAQLYHTTWDYWQDLHFANVKKSTENAQKAEDTQMNEKNIPDNLRPLWDLVLERSKDKKDAPERFKDVCIHLSIIQGIDVKEWPEWLLDLWVGAMHYTLDYWNYGWDFVKATTQLLSVQADVLGLTILPYDLVRYGQSLSRLDADGLMNYFHDEMMNLAQILRQRKEVA